jgi:hypothetical protein
MRFESARDRRRCRQRDSPLDLQRRGSYSSLCQGARRGEVDVVRFKGQDHIHLIRNRIAKAVRIPSAGSHRITGLFAPPAIFASTSIDNHLARVGRLRAWCCRPAYSVKSGNRSPFTPSCPTSPHSSRIWSYPTRYRAIKLFRSSLLNVEFSRY